MEFAMDLAMDQARGRNCPMEFAMDLIGMRPAKQQDKSAVKELLNGACPDHLTFIWEFDYKFTNYTLNRQTTLSFRNTPL